jgi:hypothetical protein
MKWLSALFETLQQRWAGPRPPDNLTLGELFLWDLERRKGTPLYEELVARIAWRRRQEEGGGHDA